MLKVSTKNLQNEQHYSSNATTSSYCNNELHASPRVSQGKIINRRRTIKPFGPYHKPLFSPIMVPLSTPPHLSTSLSTPPLSNDPSLMEDHEIFEEFDLFTQSPPSFLSSPPPSPSPTDDDNDFDFSDFPLF